MLLQLRYASKEDVPQEYLALYEEKGGEWVLTGVAGIKTQEDVDRLSESLRKEREDHKETKRTLAKFGELDPDETLSKLDRIEELEAASGGKLDETKINEMVETRLRSKTAPLERQIKALETELGDSKQSLEEYQKKDTRRTIHDQIRKAAITAKIRDTAVDDALMIGEHVFELDESGKAVTRDGVGVTPGVDPTVWFSENTRTRPHWWPETRGANARGGDGSGGGGVNPFSAEAWNMTEQGKLVTEDRARAEQMAKSAGTSIGGPRPQTK